MTTEKTTRTIEVRNVPEEREDDLRRATRRFASSAARTARTLVMIPVNMLPPESRRHMRIAGREFTLGVAVLMRDLADNLERRIAESQKQAD
jgi:hypothetical protein